MDRMDGWMDWELGRCSRVSDGQPQRTSERPFQFQPPAYSYIAIRTKNGSDLIFITFTMISGNVYRQEIHISTRPFRIRHFIMSFRFNRHPSIHSWVVLFFLSLCLWLVLDCRFWSRRRRRTNRPNPRRWWYLSAHLNWHQHSSFIYSSFARKRARIIHKHYPFFIRMPTDSTASESRVLASSQECIEVVVVLIAYAYVMIIKGEERVRQDRSLCWSIKDWRP